MARMSCKHLEVDDPLDTLIGRLFEMTGSDSDFVATVDIREMLRARRPISG